MGLLLGGAAQANLITNPTFASPTAGVQIGTNAFGTGYSYVAQGVAALNANWTWTNAGVLNATTATPWYHTTPPSGAGATQYAFMQGAHASLAQNFSLSLPSEISITWSAAGRPASSSYGGNTSYSVSTGALTSSFNTVSGSNFATFGLSGMLAPGSYTLQFLITAAAGDQTAFISNVVMTAQPAPVPEPPSAGVLLIGLAMLISWRLARPAR